MGSPDYVYPLIPRMTGGNYTNLKTDLFQPVENTYTITATVYNYDNLYLYNLWSYALGNYYRMTTGEQTIIIKCEKPIRVQKIYFGRRQGGWDWHYCDIYASNNNSDYISLGRVNEKVDTRFNYDITTPDYYYYYRFRFPQTNNYKDIDALELYGDIAN